MLKIRRPLGRLIFNMGIAIPGKTVFLIETAPCLVSNPLAEPMLIKYYTPRNMSQQGFIKNWSISVQENAIENIICKMAAIFLWFECVKTLHKPADVWEI